VLDGKGAWAGWVRGSCELACADCGKCYTMLKHLGAPTLGNLPDPGTESFKQAPIPLEACPAPKTVPLERFMQYELQLIPHFKPLGLSWGVKCVGFC